MAPKTFCTECWASALDTRPIIHEDGCTHDVDAFDKWVYEVRNAWKRRAKIYVKVGGGVLVLMLLFFSSWNGLDTTFGIIQWLASIILGQVWAHLIMRW